LLASASRDTSLGIEAMREMRASMAINNPAADASLIRLLSILDENGYSVQENTQGLAVIQGKKSLYTMVRIIEAGWQLVRHQIRRGEVLHSDIESKKLPSCLESSRKNIASKTSSAQGTEGTMYEITITPTPDQEITLEMLLVLTPRPIEM
jgi:UDP-N-acetylglucosamine enolpyruvyl transferase